MQTLHLRVARLSLYVLILCLAIHFLYEHVIGGDTPCLNIKYSVAGQWAGYLSSITKAKPYYTLT